MTADSVRLFWTFMVFIILTGLVGFYCLLITRNLIRALISLEILTKAVTLLFIVVGYVTGQQALVQALVITMIVVEVVVIVVAGGVILSVYRNDDSIDARNLRKLKG